MYAYPIEVLAETYVSKLGGFTEEVGKRELGINEEALHLNTSIIVGETEARIKILDERNPPYFLRKSFRIVGLPAHLSPNGEVVLPERLRDKLEKHVGKDVVLNTVESFRIDGDYFNVIKAIKKIEDKFKQV
ncbi:MAG: hypothetical protein H0Z28_07470 [Archaeoglobus sp.]|nr:hypothetical protein [Archaeoglobus sp.]